MLRANHNGDYGDHSESSAETASRQFAYVRITYAYMLLSNVLNYVDAVKN